MLHFSKSAEGSDSDADSLQRDALPQVGERA